jgi:EAL domain-containing protein (putative c-di-GMP-specific phosphodiesterase class I)
LWYQPKIDLKSMAVCGAEALIRLRHPEHGIIQPSAFLPPAGDPLY